MLPKDEIINDAQLNPEQIIKEVEVVEPEIINAADVQAVAQQSYLPVLAENENDLVSIKIYPNGVDMRPSETFQEIVEESYRLTERAKDLLENYTPETIDDKELSVVQKEMDAVRRYDKQVEEAIKSVRGVFNNARDAQINKIREALDKGNFSELKKYSEQIKSFKEEVLNIRRTQNWGLVFDYYNETLNAFPSLREKFPRLSSTECLQQSLPKLATGAKTWKLNDKIKAQINEFVTNLHSADETIHALQSPFESKLYEMFEAQPQIALIVQMNNQWLEEDRKRREEEQRRIEERAAQLAEEERKARELAEMRERQAKLQAEELLKQQAEAAKTPQTNIPPVNQTPTQQPATQPTVETSAPFGAQPVTDNLFEALKVAAPELMADKKSLNDCRFKSIEALNLIHFVTEALFNPNGKKEILKYITNPDQALELIQTVINQSNLSK